MIHHWRIQNFVKGCEGGGCHLLILPSPQSSLHYYYHYLILHVYPEFSSHVIGKLILSLFNFCSCSICVKKQNRHFIVPKDHLKVIQASTMFYIIKLLLHYVHCNWLKLHFSLYQMLIKFSISVIFILADYDTFPFYRARSKHLGS